MAVKRTVIRVAFDDELEAARFLQSCRRKGLDAAREDMRPMGDVKRNGPELASWLQTHTGWHVVLESANRRAAWSAAWKIRHGERRGFESLLYDARTASRNGTWIVEARYKGRAVKPGDGNGMDPLF